MMDLVNRGVIVLNEPPDGIIGSQGSESTIIVTGVARGGTTMLAQVLDRLGLFMGDIRDQVTLRKSHSRLPE